MLPYYKDGLHCSFAHSNMPALEVLEMEIQWNLSLSIKLQLKSLVVIVGGKLRLNTRDLFCGLAPTMMYVQSGNDFWPTYKADQRAALAEEQCAVPARKLPKYAWDAQGHWSARGPASFHPSSLQECFCSACPECLARAGLPILCEQAWTSDGFQKHLRPSCSKKP